MEVYTESIIENANNNRTDLIAKIGTKIEELQALLLEIDSDRRIIINSRFYSD